jgi:hypothetical protein
MAMGATGLGLLFGPEFSLPLGALGAALQFAKMVLLLQLIGMPWAPSLFRATATAAIAIVTILVGLAMTAVMVRATTVVVLPTPMEGMEAFFRWAPVLVCVAIDAMAMAMLSTRGALVRGRQGRGA